MNIAGLDSHGVRRGYVVTAAGAGKATAGFDAWVQVLDGERVTRRGAWHLHVGSGHWSAQVRPLASGGIEGAGYMRVAVGRPIPVATGERFVLREAGRSATVGGGIVLNTDTRVRAPSREGRIHALEQRRNAILAGRASDLLAAHVREGGAVGVASASAATNLTAPQAEAAAREARLLKLGGAWAHPAAAANWSSVVQQALLDHHRHHPADRSVPKHVALRAATEAGCPSEHAASLLAVLVQLGRVVAHGSGVRHPDHEQQLQRADERARHALLQVLSDERYAPPSLAQAAAQAGASPSLILELERAGDLVRIAPDIALTASAVRDAAATLHATYVREGPLTPSRAKEALGTTRKFAVPLLEELDRRGITRRTADVRVVRQP